MLILKWAWLVDLLKVSAITLYPFVMIHPSMVGNKVLLNHEKIHVAQIKEMLVIFFYIWYVAEFLMRFLSSFNYWYSYRSILFEQEAYDYQRDMNYIGGRKWFAWLRK